VDTVGIIRQIEADAGLRAQLRAVLLGDELLEMPRLLTELAEGQRRLQDALERTQATLQGFMASTEARLSSLETDVSVLKSDVAVLKSDVAVLKSDVAVLKSDVAVLKSDVSDLKGSDLERRLREHPARYLDEHVERIRVVSEEALDDLTETLSRKTALDRSEVRRLRRTDLIAEARRAGSTERVTIVAEVSATLHVDDITRAADSADILGRRGLRSFAVAAGIDLGGPEVAAAARERNVELVAMT